MKSTPQEFKQLVEDYSRHPVPDDKTVNGLRVGLIIIGVNITVPAFLVGIELGQALGISRMIVSTLIGGFILFLVGASTGIIAARTRLSTYMLLQFSFGLKGASFVNFVICMIMLCWFGITASLFANAAQASVADIANFDLGTRFYLLSGVLIMVLTTIFGFKALDKISLLFVPLMLLFLIVVVRASLQETSWEGVLSHSGGEISLGTAVSTVVGGYIIGITLFPDICRYVRKQSDAVFGGGLGCVLGYPLVLILAAIPSIALGSTDFIQMVITLGLGIAGVLMLLVATWTTNAANLYSSSLALAAIFTSIDKWKLVIVGGIIGCLISIAGIADNLIGFILILSLLVPPIAGVYIADFFVISRGDYKVDDTQKIKAINYPAFLAWGLGSTTSYIVTNSELTLTTIAAVDAIFVTFVSYILIMYLCAHKRDVPDLSADR